jgi:transposase-like protein
LEKRRKFTREFKLESVRLIKERGVSYVQASQDLGVHVSQLRNCVKALADDPQHAFPGHGQLKPEPQEIGAQLICPTGRLAKIPSIPRAKNNSVFQNCNQMY